MPTYYIPSDSFNIPSFYSRACIVPRKYLNTEQIGLQDSFPSYLLLSKRINVSNCDCIIEIVLSDTEEKQLLPLQGNPGFFLSVFPVPLSRIKVLYFKSEEMRQKIVAIINMGSGFIDSEITKIIDSNGDNLQLRDTKAKYKANIDLSKRLNTYDRLLGGFSLLRTASEPPMNYSENYFQTLSIFNELIKSELINHGLDSHSWLQDAFFGRDRFKHLYPFLQKQITEQDIRELARHENQTLKLNELTGKIDLAVLDKMTYVLAFLYTYGVGEEAKKQKVDSLIVNSFSGNIPTKFSETIALCYGLNRGYTVLSNEYKVGEKSKTVKFKLKNKLDYYTIESLFQFSFHGILNNKNFHHLDSQFSFQSVAVKRTGSMSILGENVFSKKKPTVGSGEYIAHLSQLYFQKGIEAAMQPFLSAVTSKVLVDLKQENDPILEDKDKEMASLRKALADSDEMNSKIVNELNYNAQELKELKAELTKLRMQPVVDVARPINKTNDLASDEASAPEYRFVLLLKTLLREKNARRIHLLIQNYIKNSEI
jgi:hypothetical protein